LTPAAINFNGSTSGVLTGQSSSTFQVTASNSGPALAFTSSITGPFSIVTNACGGAIPAAGSCNLTLTFTPTQAGAATGTLTLMDAAGMQTVALSGTGLAPATDILSTTALAFPNTVKGQLSAAESVTVTNTGGVNLTGISVSVSPTSGTNYAADFQVNNSCTAILGPNHLSCAISVQFNPSVVGLETATLTISSSASDSPKTVSLSGTGLQPPTLGVSPLSLSFTGQTVGQASTPQTVTVTNTGGAPLNNIGFQINTISGGAFSCIPSSCSAISCPSLASGASCAVQIIFTPAAAGGSSASLVISSSNSTPNQVTVPLNGGGVTAAGLNVSPSQLTFPLVASGQTSSPQTVTLTNNGGSAISSLTIAATAPFGVVSNNCSSTLAAGATCTTGVNFAPSVNGKFTGTLTIASSSLAASASVALSGTGGVPGSVSFQPSQLSFTQTGVGQTSGVSTVTITNPDAVTSLTNLALAVTTGFQLASTTCPTTPPATLGPGASCTVDIKFTPSAAGAQSGTLTVSDSAATAGTALALSGTGFDFSICFGSSITPCVTTSSQSVANGGIADYALTIEPLGGTAASFTLQCGTLPSNASCAFSPSSPTPSSTAPVYETVKIATGGSTARLKRPFGWPALPLFCGLAYLPLALRRRRRVLAMILLLAVLAGGVSSCSSSGGGSSTGTGTGTGTTPESYSIVVTASSNGVSHPITLTLIVD
jgi:hypothetical protein